MSATGSLSSAQKARKLQRPRQEKKRRSPPSKRKENQKPRRKKRRLQDDKRNRPPQESLLRQPWRRERRRKPKRGVSKLRRLRGESLRNLVLISPALKAQGRTVA